MESQHLLASSSDQNPNNKRDEIKRSPLPGILKSSKSNIINDSPSKVPLLKYPCDSLTNTQENNQDSNSVRKIVSDNNSKKVAIGSMELRK